jgi:ATP-dependent Clp protease ATP-binding subunit ClpA
MKTLLDRFLPARYDGDLTQCLDRAESLARSYAHDYVGVEHVFLSLRDLSPEHPVATILAKLPVDVAAFWQDLEQEARVVTGRRVPDSLPYTPRLDFILRAACRIAKLRKKRDVSLYHFVSSVALEHTSLVAQVFCRHLRIRGQLTSFQEASARLFALIVAFPDLMKFDATGEANQRIAPDFMSK